MATLTAGVHGLRRIDTWPIDLTDPFFARYSTMKLGAQQDAWHYADQLLPIVHEIIDGSPGITDWVATAPQRLVLPAAANLLCERVVERLQSRLPPGRRLLLADLVERPAALKIEDPLQFRRYNDYSRMSVQEREEAYAVRTFSPNPADYAGRGVLFVNDINVTGTQLRFVRDRLAATGPAAVHFVYLIDCAPGVGRAYPHLEAAINGFDRLTPDTIAAILRRPDLRHTPKCLSTIMSLPIAVIEDTVALLDSVSRARLCELYRVEGRYDGPMFEERLRVIDGG